MPDTIDELIKQIPEGWDFWLGSSWNDAGETVFYARIQQRSLGEFFHAGHYIKEIEAEAVTLEAALRQVINEAGKG